VPGDPPVQELSWQAPARPPVVLDRIVGGGHLWPGGPQFMPKFLIGRGAQHLNATGILLRFAQDAVTGPS
jgi:poly(3-hydroxybutyrate) depolymerase